MFISLQLRGSHIQNLKGNDHLISHTVLSGHLVPKKRDMLPRKKPWLVPIGIISFLNIIEIKAGFAETLMPIMKIMFLTLTISIKQN